MSRPLTRCCFRRRTSGLPSRSLFRSYDVNLFLDGIGQALSGDPVGLVNAIGDPLAADVGLVTLAGGIEFFVVQNAATTILFGTPHPGLV